MITPSSGKFALSACTVRGTRPSGFQASSAPGVLPARSITGNSASAGTPSRTASSATRSNRSIDTRSTPGIEGTASLRSAPSSTNTG